MRPTIRKFMSDTLAMIVFTTIGAMAIELLISRLTLRQSLEARGMAVVVNLFTAWLYGVYRDWMFRATSANAGTWVRRLLVDVAAYTTFKTPLYVVILVIAGATVPQVLAACVSCTIAEIAMGRPFGIFMDWMRRKFGVQQAVAVQAVVAEEAS